MNEREINLVDLMVEILLRWRMILVWMLVGGMLMGCFSYMRSVQGKKDMEQLASEQPASEQEMLALLEKSLTSMQKNNVHTVLKYEEFQDYYNCSLLMQIDAANAPKTELVYWVSSNNIEQSPNIGQLYEAALLNGLAEWLAANDPEQMDIKLSELITVTSGTRSSSSLIQTNVDTQNELFSIQILHLNEKECADLADQVEEYMNYLHAQLEPNIGAHDLFLVSRSFAMVMDANLLAQQRTMASNITASNAAADKLIQDFSDDEQVYYDLLKAKQTSEENVLESEEILQQSIEETGSASKVSVSVKYILLGMVLFAFLYVFYLFMKYILDNRLRATDDIGEIYDLPQLGNIPQKVSRRKFLGFVDDWILKLRNVNKRIFAEEEAIGLAAVAVKIAVKKEAVNTVFCIGCDMKGRTHKVAEQLQTILKEENITMNILSNVLYDQEALEQLSSAKCVFLLETAGGTFYGEIAKELELLKRQEINVIGGIIVE